MEAAGRSRGCPCRLCLEWRIDIIISKLRFALSCPAIRNVQACGLLVKWYIEAIGQEWFYRSIPSKWGKRYHWPTRTCLIPTRVFIDTKCEAWSKG